MILDKILRRPLITEKSTRETTDNKFTFEVSLNSTKDSISEAVNKKYKVDVTSVKTMVIPGKKKRITGRRDYYKTSKWKKAVVTLKAGQKIPVFEVSEKEK